MDTNRRLAASMMWETVIITSPFLQMHMRNKLLEMMTSTVRDGGATETFDEVQFRS